MKSSRFLLFLIITLSTVFRFSRNDMLQFWSDDEEIHAAVVQRMIVTKRPTLVSPQPTTGTSIGSFFHMASVPLFLISKMDPQKILSLFSITGLLTTFTIYVLGKEIGGKKLGFVASFLYATSFLAGLYDRRWWPITLTPLLSAIGLVAALRLVKTRNPRYLYLLVGVTATALHGDPAMLLFGLFILVLLITHRIWFPIQAWLVSAVIIFVAISPLALFEFRHPGTIVKPLIETLQRKQSSTVQNSGFLPAFTLTAETTRWLVIPKVTEQVEPLLYPMNVTLDALESTMQIVVVTLGIAYFMIRFYRSRKNNPGVSLIVLYLATFFFGFFLFSSVYRHPPQRVYITLLFPALFLIIAWFLIHFVTRKSILCVALLLSLAVNTQALFRSRYMYPLLTRQRIVTAAIDQLDGKDFSLYVTGDPYLESDGFTRLFILAGAIPKKSFTDKTLGWWYRTHSLYLTEPTSEDQIRIVSIVPSNLDSTSDHLLVNKKIDTLRLLIFENETKWFSEINLP